MPLTKREDTTKQTKGVEASTVYVLNTFISWNPRDDGRISVADVAKALDDIDIETRSGEIRRWLNGSVCPRARAIWDLGYALRRAGCPWMTGLWLLWACERYTECYRILQYLSTQASALSSKQFGLLRHMFASLRPLAERTVFDRGLADREDYTPWPQYVRNEFLNKETLDALRTWAAESKGDGWDDINDGAPRAIARDLGTVLRREVAKIPWIGHDNLERELREAGQAFLSGEPPRVHLECDAHINSAIRLVSAGNEVADATLDICQRLVTEYIDDICFQCIGRNPKIDDEITELLSDDYSRYITTVWINEWTSDDHYEELLNRIQEVTERIESTNYREDDPILF